MKNETSTDYKPISIDEVRDYILNDESKKGLPEYWLIYSPEILAIINKYVEEGNYPYNTNIEKLVNEKLFPEMAQGEDRLFAHVVYTSQGYRHLLQEEKAAIKLDELMIENGFIKATPELLNQVVETNRKFYIAVTSENVLNGRKEVTQKKDKLLLKDWGERSGGLHWMNPRAKRAGYKATIGQYIKEAI